MAIQNMQAGSITLLTNPTDTNSLLLRLTFRPSAASKQSSTYKRYLS